jgi:hypothetical protein
MTVPAMTWAYVRSQRGGDEGTRTLNPRRAKAVLYQLSYVPGSQARPVPSGDSDAWCGGFAPEVGLCLGGTLTLDENQCNETDEQQHDHLLHDGSPPSHDG